MSRAAWAAIIAAIAFPSVALIVVLTSRPEPPPDFPRTGPPRHMNKPPPLRPESLIRLREPLELSDEQVEEIWKIGQPAHRRMIEIKAALAEKQHDLMGKLDSDEAEEEEVLEALEELHDLHFELEKIKVLTPLRLRRVLTKEQRDKLIEIWRREAPERDHGPPGRFGPPLGKGPRGPGGFGPPLGKGPRGPGGFGPGHGPLPPGPDAFDPHPGKMPPAGDPQ